MIGDSELLVGSESDGLSLGVIQPPFSSVSLWRSDSESVLSSSDVLVVEQNSLRVHSGHDLELSSFFESRKFGLVSLVDRDNVPLLVLSLVAGPDDDLVVAGVLATVTVNAKVLVLEGSEVGC